MSSNTSTVTTTDQSTATPYQTLISVNSIDQEKFKSSDLKSIKELWNKIFIQNTVSEEIYDAIAAKSGAAQVTNDAASTLF